MPIPNIFESDLFSTTALTAAVDRVDYLPQMLGQLGVFTRRGVTADTLFVDRRGRKLALIPTSPRGAAPYQLAPDDRDAVPLKTVRLAKSSTISASEIARVRAFNRESEVQTMQAEVARRLAELRRDMELTHEHHRLGAVQGKVLDADGTTVVANYFTLFGVAEPTPINFALDTASTNVRQLCVDMARTMARAGGGAVPPTARIVALAGDEFYDKLVSHQSVEKYYLNRPGRDLSQEGGAFETFRFGGIDWINYRGTDDNSEVAIAPDEARFFPVGAPDVFVHAMAPDDEYIQGVGAVGREVYARQYADHHDPAMQRGQVVQVDSYPLFFCARPEVLRSGVAA
jgi:hypothetical protein